MPNKFTIKLDTRGLDNMIKNTSPLAEQVINKTAFDVEGSAKRWVASFPAVKTGALLNSIYTKTTRGEFRNNKPDDESNIGRDVLRRNPEASIDVLPRPPKLTAYVGPSVHYALYVHWGTVKMGARPFLLNAVEQVRPSFVAAWKALLTGPKTLKDYLS